MDLSLLHLSKSRYFVMCRLYCPESAFFFHEKLPLDTPPRSAELTPKACWGEEAGSSEARALLQFQAISKGVCALRRSSHAVYDLKYGFVWIPKYRKPILVRGVAEYAREVLQRIGEEYGFSIDAMDGREDHVHMKLRRSARQRKRHRY